MAETLIPQGVAVNPVNGLRLRLGHNAEDLLGSAKTLTPQDAQFQALDPDGATSYNVILPAESASQGLFFVIKNTANAGSEALAVIDDGAGAIATLTQNMLCVCFCDGDAWSTTGLISYSAGT